MVERVAERGKEPEPQELIYDYIYRWMDQRTRKRREAPVVVKYKDLEWEQNRQGLIKFYLHPGNWDKLGVPYWNVFIHHIKRHSGKHTHKGGVVLFVLEGKGYTVVNGVRWDWEKGDMVILPVNPAGNEHQHFNAEPGKPAIWLAMIYYPFYEAVGCYVQQKEASPDWQGDLLPPPTHVA